MPVPQSAAGGSRAAARGAGRGRGAAGAAAGPQQQLSGGELGGSGGAESGPAPRGDPERLAGWWCLEVLDLVLM